MNRQERLEAELVRTGQMRAFERQLAGELLGRDEGAQILIGGIDEAGRGYAGGTRRGSGGHSSG